MPRAYLDPPPVLLAYCAGVIDSDGTIGVKRSTYQVRVVKDSTQPIFSERIAVRQVELEAIELLHSLFGGYLRIGEPPSAKKGRPLNMWMVTDKQAAECLRLLLPYLRIKRKQAENCLRLRELKEESKKARIAVGRGHAGAGFRPAHLSEGMEQTYTIAASLNAVGVK